MRNEISLRDKPTKCNECCYYVPNWKYRICRYAICPYNIRDSTLRKVPLKKENFPSKEVVTMENV